MIKKYMTVWAVSSAVFLLPHTAVAATLADSIAEALVTHPAIEAGKASASAADKTVWEQRSTFFPTIGLNNTFGRSFANNDTTRANTGGSGAYSWTGQGSVTLTQPVFAGFGNVNRYAAAKDRHDVAAFELGGSYEDVAMRSARAHLNLMRTQELLGMADEYYVSIQARHDSIVLMVDEGLIDESQRLQAQEILTNAKNTRLGYEEAWHQAEADYIESVGIKPDAALSLGENVWGGYVPEDLDAAIEKGLIQSPRVLAARKLVKALGKEAKATKSALYPQLNAEMTYTERDQAETLGGEATDASAILRMTWNLSTGGAEFARAKRGVDERSAANARRRQAERDVEHDIRQRFTSMNIVDEQLSLLISREEYMEGILTSFLAQFEAGKQSNLQLISAHVRLFQARGGRVDAYYRRLLSRLELLGAMGGLRETFGFIEGAEKQVVATGYVSEEMPVAWDAAPVEEIPVEESKVEWNESDVKEVVPETILEAVEEAVEEIPVEESKVEWNESDVEEVVPETILEAVEESVEEIPVEESKVEWNEADVEDVVPEIVLEAVEETVPVQEVTPEEVIVESVSQESKIEWKNEQAIVQENGSEIIWEQEAVETAPVEEASPVESAPKAPWSDEEKSLLEMRAY